MRRFIVLKAAILLIAIGTSFSIPQVGYSEDVEGLAAEDLSTEPSSSNTCKDPVFAAASESRVAYELNYQDVFASEKGLAIRLGGWDPAAQTFVVDSTWTKTLERAQSDGRRHVVYCDFLTDVSLAQSQIDGMLRALSSTTLDCPLFLSLSDGAYTSQQLSVLTSALDIFHEQGYLVGVMARSSWWEDLPDNSLANGVLAWSEQDGYSGIPHIKDYGGIEGESSESALDSDGEDLPSDSGPFDSAVEGDVPSSLSTEGSLQLGFRVHCSNVGWMDPVGSGDIGGDLEREHPVEAIEFDTSDQLIKNSLRITTHVAEKGWASAVTGEQMAGSTGQSLPMQAISIELAGNLASTHDVYYRVFVDGVGWMGLAKNGEYAGTQGKAKSILGIQVFLQESDDAAPVVSAPAVDEAFQCVPAAVSYAAHVTNLGWLATASNGATAGTVGKALSLQAISFKLAQLLPNESGAIEGDAHVSEIGWQGWRTGQIGTTGRNLPIEAVRFRLSGNASDVYDVYYRLHVSDIGWMGWAKNGEPAGTQGYAKSAEAIQLVLVQKDGRAPDSSDSATEDAFRKKPLGISYQAHVSNIGWTGYVSDGNTVGTTGRALPMEAVKASLTNLGEDEEGCIRLSAHVSEIGWMDWATGTAGTTGQHKSMEAIKAKLDGNIATHYDLYYRVHCAGFGWLGWTKNGGEAGTSGLSCPIEALQIRLVKKGAPAPNEGTAFISAPVGLISASIAGSWQPTVTFGAVAGTTGQGRSLDGFKLSIDSAVDGSVSYRAHCANIGWQNYVEEGSVAGGAGSGNALQAIQISLTGDLSKLFDIWYRVHVDDIGWLGWASNGMTAGTTSCALNIQAIQVVVRAKGSSAPGATSGSSYVNKAALPYVGFQNPSGYPQVSNKTVKLPSYCHGEFTYVTPSRIPFNATRQQCVEAFIGRAVEYLGTRYIEPYSTAPGGAVDCSGLVLQCLYATGMDMGWYNPYNHRWLPEQTYNSMNWYRNNTFKPVSVSNMIRGDVVYYSGHIAIYLGNGQIIDSWPRIGVTIRSLYAPGTPIGAGRPYVS